MSQDDRTCAICDERCGYDNEARIWDGRDRKGDYHSRICGRCVGNLMSRFCAFFGIEGMSWDQFGAEIEWDDMKRILDGVKRDCTMRISYIVTDKELYEREVRVKTPIESDVLSPV